MKTLALLFILTTAALANPQTGYVLKSDSDRLAEERRQKAAELKSHIDRYVARRAAERETERQKALDLLFRIRVMELLERGSRY